MPSTLTTIYQQTFVECAVLSDFYVYRNVPPASYGANVFQTGSGANALLSGWASLTGRRVHVPIGATNNYMNANNNWDQWVANATIIEDLPTYPTE